MRQPFILTRSIALSEYVLLSLSFGNWSLKAFAYSIVFSYQAIPRQSNLNRDFSVIFMIMISVFSGSLWLVFSEALLCGEQSAP
jgi:hypothetical protein